MSFSINSENRLIYTFETEINLLDFNPKYPKYPKNFGERLRKKRMDLGLTMKDIAEKLGVSETTVYNWEIRGKMPAGSNLEKLNLFLEDQLSSSG